MITIHQIRTAIKAEYGSTEGYRDLVSESDGIRDGKHRRIRHQNISEFYQLRPDLKQRALKGKAAK